MPEGLPAEQLVEDRWYRVKVARPGGLSLRAPDFPRGVDWRAGLEVVMVWRGRGDAPDSDLRWVNDGPEKAKQVPTAGVFWTGYDVDGALICHYEDVEVLEEVPNPLRGR
jgi:hypothetical protein